MNSLKYWFSYLRGRYRLMLGVCPLCNSDAPNLYDCPCCDWYSSQRGSKFPPQKKIKAEWWGKYLSAIKFKRNLPKIIKRIEQGYCVHCGVYCTGKSVFCTPPLDDKRIEFK